MRMQIQWQQRLDFFDRFGSRQARQHALEPRVRSKAIRFGRLDQRIDHSAGVRAGCRVAKQPSFSSHNKVAFPQILCKRPLSTVLRYS